MENFEFEKSTYLSELRDVLFTEELSIYEYAKELGEENIELIRNPKNFGELNLVKRALEMFSKLKEVSKTEEFDADNNSAYIFSYLATKSIRKPEYFEYAVEFVEEVSKDKYLSGKLVVDKLSMPEDAIKSVVDYEIECTNSNPLEFVFTLMAATVLILAKASMKLDKNGFGDDLTQDSIEKGIPTYLHNNECVNTYLNERATSKKDEYVMNYRINKGI